MEKCNRCARTEEEVRLFDGFYVNEPVKICEKCSILSNIPIVKRPTANQLKTSEKAIFDVRKRLSAMAGLNPKIDQEKTLAEELRQFQDNPSLEKPEDLVFKLVDNFHWVIQTERRRKGIYLNQLAASIGESESALKMLEKGIVPNDAMGLIQKVELFLKIKLIKKEQYSSLLNKSNPVFESTKSVVPVSKQIILPDPAKNVPEVLKKEVRKEQMQKEESNDMLRKAIVSERNSVIKSREQVDGTPLRIESFRRDKIAGINLADFKRIEDNAEKSFEIENMKTRAEISREQVEDFGKKDNEQLRRKVYGEESRSRISESVAEKLKAGKTPSIYELSKLREERRRKLSGREITIENPELSNKKDIISEVLNESEDKAEERKKGIISNLKDIFGFNKKKESFDVDLETGKLLE